MRKMFGAACAVVLVLGIAAPAWGGVDESGTSPFDLRNADFFGRCQREKLEIDDSSPLPLSFDRDPFVERSNDFLADTLSIAQGFSEDRADSAGTRLVPSVRVGVAYPRWDFDETDLAGETVRANADFTAIAAFQLEFRLFRDISLYAGFESDRGKDIHASLFSAGVGYTLYYPVSNKFETIEERAAIVGGFLYGKLAVDNKGFVGDFDPSVGVYAAIDYTKTIELNWEVNMAIGIRYMKFDYNVDRALILDAPDTIGAEVIYFTLGIGYRF